MPSDQGEHFQANCKLIYGDYDYDLEFETDDYVHYNCVVRKDFGLHFGPLLIMTHYYPSIEAASAELNRMLAHMVAHVESGKSMSK